MQLRGGTLALFRSGLLGSALVLAASALFIATNHRDNPVRAMTDTANHLLVSLSDEQKQVITIPFTDEQRFDFHFIPRDRKGLPLRQMTPHQRHLAYAMLSSGLSQQGLIKATTIMSLEDVLRILEKDSGERRNPEKYYFSIFGTPSETGTWGWRVEGHHLSLNFTLVNGKVSSTPFFFGTNPAEVREGPRAGLRVLGREEDLARNLLAALDPNQLKVAIVDDKAPDDMLTFNNRRAELKDQKAGLPIAKMTPKQRGLFQELIDEYVYNLPDALALAREQQIRAAGADLSFAWMGSTKKGERHYYRIQAPAFLIEYDNTQNGANHIHSIWRDIEGDFGLDLLAEHLKKSHAR